MNTENNRNANAFPYGGWNSDLNLGNDNETHFRLPSGGPKNNAEGDATHLALTPTIIQTDAPTPSLLTYAAQILLRPTASLPHRPSSRVPTIKRPPNCWLCYRSFNGRLPEYAELSQRDVCYDLGSRWRALPPSEKVFWEELAKEVKRVHGLMYPDYKYQPKKRVAKVKAKKKTEKKGEEIGEEGGKKRREKKTRVVSAGYAPYPLPIRQNNTSSPNTPSIDSPSSSACPQTPLSDPAEFMPQIVAQTFTHPLFYYSPSWTASQLPATPSSNPIAIAGATDFLKPAPHTTFPFPASFLPSEERATSDDPTAGGAFADDNDLTSLYVRTDELEFIPAKEGEKPLPAPAPAPLVNRANPIFEPIFETLSPREDRPISIPIAISLRPVPASSSASAATSASALAPASGSGVVPLQDVPETLPSFQSISNIGSASAFTPTHAPSGTQEVSHPSFFYNEFDLLSGAVTETGNDSEMDNFLSQFPPDFQYSDTSDF